MTREVPVIGRGTGSVRDPCRSPARNDTISGASGHWAMRPLHRIGKLVAIVLPAFRPIIAPLTPTHLTVTNTSHERLEGNAETRPQDRYDGKPHGDRRNRAPECLAGTSGVGRGSAEATSRLATCSTMTIRTAPTEPAFGKARFADLTVARDADAEDEVNVAWKTTNPATWGLGPNTFNASLVVLLDDGDDLDTRTLSLGTGKTTFTDVRTGTEVEGPDGDCGRYPGRQLPHQ